ncbi:MAG: efflux RND transporter periplasmic adaptor subunit, partial [Inhella sp.]
LALAWAAHAQDPAAPVAAKPSLTIQTTLAQPAQWATRLPVNGNVAAWQEAVIGAEVGGMRIAEVLVNVGDRVKKGQVLVRLSPGTLQADLAATRASLQEAEISARDARAQAERVRPLAGTEALSAQAIDAALAAADMAEARVASLKARLMADELRLGYTRIAAPDDGVITAREAVEGALAQPGQELLRLQRQGRLEWRAEVPGPLLDQVKVGQRARVQLGTTAVEGRVRQVAPKIDPQTRNGLVYVDLPATAGARAGLFARGDLLQGEGQVLTLPQSAVLLRDGFSYVFKLEGSKVRQAKVEVGQRQGDRVEIKTGLDAKTPVALSGLGFLADGDTVRVAK